MVILIAAQLLFLEIGLSERIPCDDPHAPMLGNRVEPFLRVLVFIAQ
jgi:hypothetical protein